MTVSCSTTLRDRRSRDSIRSTSNRPASASATHALAPGRRLTGAAPLHGTVRVHRDDGQPERGCAFAAETSLILDRGDGLQLVLKRA